ncbi:synaptogenesis protein syg-2-like isoform X1 [Tachypleus tridentatus]|uniref:synaptogenesis protein syg-2-like isoform X1 n=1 Tax=Tachypleus tridentatus TaxID=6853 RepID=UPI003FD0D25F
MASCLYSCVFLLLWAQHVFSGIPSIKLKPVHHYIDQEEYTEYSFVAGGKLILPCDISPPSDDRVMLMLWYQGTSGYPVFIVDARFQESITSAELENHTSRITLNITERKAFLIIEPVKEEDAGEYRCRVDYLRGRTVRRNHMVNIIVPTRDIRIRHGDYLYVRGSIGPIVEGSFLNLTCEAVGGNPSPDVTWWRSSTLLDDTDFKVSNNIVANTYSIPYVSRNYSQTVLTCNASNTEFYPPVSVTIKLDLNLRPQYVRITSTTDSLLAGKQVEIVCQTKGSFPPAEVSWWLEGQKLKRFQKSLTDNTGLTSSYVTFTPRSDDNGKNLTCRVKNPRSSEIALEDNRKLNVLYKPKLTLTLRNSNGNHRIKEGTCVYLDCRVIANPQIRDLLWKVDGRILTSNQLTGIEIREQSLKLKNVTRGLEGRYHCTAQNIVGISRSNNISLVILPSPEPVQNCSVENLTLKSMKVVCSPGSRYEETKYHLVAYTTNGQQLLVNSTSFDCPVFIIDHLPADTLLVISIHSSNSQGNSAAVVLEARTLSSVEEDTRETTLLSVPLKITRHSGILVLT